MFSRHTTDFATSPDVKFMAKLRADLVRRYKKRRSDKLAGKEPVNLRKIPFDIGATGEMMTLKAEQVQMAMLDLLDQCNGRLLLTGVPGAGKTTLLLQLAEALFNRSETVAHLEGMPQLPPFPALLNLASWRSEFKTIDTWLEQVLHLELSTNRAGADRIRQTVPLILLFDGLDEVLEDDRPSCLAAIGEYGVDSNRQFAVSCRKEELKALEQYIPANIYLSIEVALLTPEQIENQLIAWSFNQPEAKPLLQAIRQDAPLLEALRTPFYLNTAQLLFASGKRWEHFDFSKTGDAKAREADILERFIENTLKDGWRTHSPDEVRHWLAFLASQMNREGLMVFELRDLQYGWWKLGRLQFAVAGIAIGLSPWGILGSLFAGLALQIFKPGFWPAGLIGGLLLLGLTGSIGAALRKTPPDIWTNDTLKWSTQELISLMKTKIMIRVGVFLSIAVSLYWGCIGWHFTGDVIKTLLFTLAGIPGGFSIVLILSILQTFINAGIDFPLIRTPYQRFRNSAKNFHFSILQHWHLRWLLYRRGLLPLRLVYFLNDMADRHLMETEGATWRFRHRMVQEYFAGNWEEE